MPAVLLRRFLFSGCGCTVLINPHAVYLSKPGADFLYWSAGFKVPAAGVGGFVRSFCVRHLFRCFRASGVLSFRFSVDRGLMCGYLLLFHDSFIIFHVKNNAVQHAYYYHNTFAPHCFCGLAGREVFCAVMGVPAQIFGLFGCVRSCCTLCRVLCCVFCCRVDFLCFLVSRGYWSGTYFQNSQVINNLLNKHYSAVTLQFWFLLIRVRCRFMLPLTAQGYERRASSHVAWKNIFCMCHSSDYSTNRIRYLDAVLPEE